MRATHIRPGTFFITTTRPLPSSHFRVLEEVRERGAVFWNLLVKPLTDNSLGCTDSPKQAKMTETWGEATIFIQQRIVRGEV